MHVVSICRCRCVCVAEWNTSELKLVDVAMRRMTEARSGWLSLASDHLPGHISRLTSLDGSQLSFWSLANLELLFFRFVLIDLGSILSAPSYILYWSSSPKVDIGYRTSFWWIVFTGFVGILMDSLWKACWSLSSNDGMGGCFVFGEWYILTKTTLFSIIHVMPQWAEWMKCLRYAEAWI